MPMKSMLNVGTIIYRLLANLTNET